MRGGCEALHPAKGARAIADDGSNSYNTFLTWQVRRGEWDEFSDDDLRRTFLKYGEIDPKMSYMIRDGLTQQHKGYGFVAYKTAGDRAA